MKNEDTLKLDNLCRLAKSEGKGVLCQYLPNAGVWMFNVTKDPR